MTEVPQKGVNGPAVRPASEIPTAAFALSLVAGLLILASVVMMSTFRYGAAYNGMMGGYYGMMNSYYGMMGGFGYGGWYYGALTLGLISGIGVLAGAIMIYTRPKNAPTWGLIVLVFSILGFSTMGGFFVGAILGIVGGALAMAWRPGAALN